MKVIFFDVDGPMVPGRSSFLPENIVPSYGWQFDPCAVGMLNFLAWAIPDLRVVIASHRIGMNSPIKGHRGTQTRDFWVDIFKANGLKIPIHQHWVTVRSPDGDRPKFEEIADWLKLHPDVKTFVTIDDEAAGYDDDVSPAQREQFNLCAESYNDGISYADFVRMAKFLGIQLPADSYVLHHTPLYDKYRKELLRTGSGVNEKAGATHNSSRVIDSKIAGSGELSS